MKSMKSALCLTVLYGRSGCAGVVEVPAVGADCTGAGADAALSRIVAWVVGKEGVELLAPTSCLSSPPLASPSLLAPHSRLCPALHPVIWHAFEQYRGAVSFP